MPQPVRCPGCNRQLLVPDEVQGKQIRCPRCETVFRVPEAPQQEPEFELVEEEPSRAAEEQLVPQADPAREGITSQKKEEPSPSSEEEAVPEAQPRPRRRRRRRKKKSSDNPVLDNLYYYTAAFGVFPWIAAALVMIWCCMGTFSLFVPGLPLVVILFGAALYNGGWFWLLFVAFRDDTFHGMICLFTHFYWIVYAFVNLEETWQPVTLMILGVLVAASGGILLGVSLAHASKARSEWRQPNPLTAPREQTATAGPRLSPWLGLAPWPSTSFNTRDLESACATPPGKQYLVES